MIKMSLEKGIVWITNKNKRAPVSGRFFYCNKKDTYGGVSCVVTYEQRLVYILGQAKCH